MQKRMKRARLCGRLEGKRSRRERGRQSELESEKERQTSAVEETLDLLYIGRGKRNHSSLSHGSLLQERPGITRTGVFKGLFKP